MVFFKFLLVFFHLNLIFNEHSSHSNSKDSITRSYSTIKKPEEKPNDDKHKKQKIEPFSIDFIILFEILSHSSALNTFKVYLKHLLHQYNEVLRHWSAPYKLNLVSIFSFDLYKKESKYDELSKLAGSDDLKKRAEILKNTKENVLLIANPRGSVESAKNLSEIKECGFYYLVNMEDPEYSKYDFLSLLHNSVLNLLKEILKEEKMVDFFDPKVSDEEKYKFITRLRNNPFESFKKCKKEKAFIENRSIFGDGPLYNVDKALDYIENQEKTPASSSDDSSDELPDDILKRDTEDSKDSAHLNKKENRLSSKSAKKRESRKADDHEDIATNRNISQLFKQISNIGHEMSLLKSKVDGLVKSNARSKHGDEQDLRTQNVVSNPSYLHNNRNKSPHFAPRQHTPN